MQFLQSLCEKLNYPGDSGFLQASSGFSQAIGAIHSLSAAATAVNLHSCFGVWEQGFNGSAQARFVPLVYLTDASDVAEARRIHRWVWSQGVVPWLVIASPNEVFVCPGFDFAPEGRWERLVRRVALPKSTQSLQQSCLADFTAIKLKSSVRWRDFSHQASGAVDKRLLIALNDLHQVISSDEHGALTPGVTNLLIGRIFYTFLLFDRELIPLSWSPSVLRNSTSMPGRSSMSIPLAEFWLLQDRIDDAFNGGVFQIDDKQRRKISQDQLDLAVGFIRGGRSLQGGGVQSDLFDIDLTALQVETLSAVYEEFLRNEAPAGARGDGVVYTPSFLVDFVVNRVDDELELDASSKILDPTAGSGVFLVACYRRIVERTLAERGLSSLPMEELRKILQSSIYGVEKSASAAAVTAFSLYLNLLEYCSEEEVRAVVHHGKRPRVFPPLLGKNILVKDFFSPGHHFPNVQFTAAVGNPPWRPIDAVSSYGPILARHPIDGDEAAEQIVWEMLTEYVVEGGMLAMVMPSKSFASPSAKLFATQLGSCFHVKAVVNLSHWRRHLFENAVQPAALLFVSQKAVTHSSRTFFYAPPLWGQPFKPAAMWTLAVDRADMFSLPSTFAFSGPENTFDAYMLRPLERAVKSRLKRGGEGRAAITLAQLLIDLDLKTAGGSTAKRTGLDVEELCSPKDLLPRRAAGAERSFFVLEKHDKALSVARLSECNETHVAKFRGERLFVPRSMQYAALLDFPLAANSSLNVIHWEHEEEHPQFKDARRYILTRLGRFLVSDVARYQFALFGQLWQIDRTRIETRDLLKIITPPKEFFVEEIGAVDEKSILAAMGALDISEPMHDYLNTRAQFENGISPPDANHADSCVPQDYLQVLTATLKGSFGSLVQGCKEESVGETEICVRINFEEALPKPLNFLSSDSQFQYFESTRVTWSAGERHMLLSKPNGNLYFTMERAYADALRVSNILLSTP
ncbi:HsdM family class I SAM-dependent methyltransferase [Herbaspirillum huttiense]|uniref:HsdM family class I SAM-dependent methyltransferase n=1 Tax=Herbaspirillum huttiense TaxID=863372 RepID=UPI0031D0898A